jgi:glycosyltransferase involved in cell wall biosynthesis
VKDSLALSTLVFVETAVNNLLHSYSKNVSRFVVPSRFLIDKMVEWGWPRERFAWVPNFVEASEFEVSTEAGHEFVYVGRLSADKGVATLIKAAATARVGLAVVGAGPDEERLRALVASLGANVRFLGYLSGEALRKVIGQARAVVLPSQIYENAPMSVLEAYAAGRPVIGARIGGIPELIRERETGATFTSGDAQDLAGVLSEFAGYPDARLAQMGRAGREWVESDFSAHRHRELLLEEYRKLGLQC